MRKLLVLVLFLVFSLVAIFPAEATIQYDMADAMIGDAEAFPLERGFVEERLGKPDFTENIAGFPVPVEYYVVEGSDEISHIYLIYGAGEKGNQTYAMGVVMKGIDLATMVGMLEGMAEEGASMVILRGEQFAILDVLGPGAPQALWALFEERPFQGEERLVSTLIPPENLVAYFAAAYPGFQEPLKKAIEERVKKEQ
ncbi:MAG: hypothetical protein HPY68_02015 [Candidatus Atribacteria bacterium]|nr:hypothetical protein [Candidatus Atribacteria bacterium]